MGDDIELTCRAVLDCAKGVFGMAKAFVAPDYVDAAGDAVELLVAEPGGFTNDVPQELWRATEAAERPLLFAANLICPIGFHAGGLILPVRRAGVLIGLVAIETPGEEPKLVELFAAYASEALLGAIAMGEARRQTERADRSKQRLKSTYDLLLQHQRYGKMGDFRYNMTTRLTTGSVECSRMFGYPPELEIVGYERWLAKLHPDDRDRAEQEIAAALDRMAPLRVEYRIIVDGMIKHILQQGEPEIDENGERYYRGVLSDISHQKAAAEKLRAAQTELSSALRLATVGELTGSIAHEINQPLTALLASGQACQRWLAQGPDKLDEASISLSRVLGEARRAIAVVEGLRTIVKSAKTVLDTVDLNEAIGEVLVLSRQEIEQTGAILRTDLGELPALPADRVQLQQVVHNLVRNALDAMRPVRDRRRILTISSRVEHDAATVTVTDTGHGFEPGTAERLFHALYTTKQGGMGLGLAICRKIIESHEGCLRAMLNRPHGATFAFTIPLQRNAMSDPAETIR
jgi:signal transduction histidine kinase